MNNLRDLFEEQLQDLYSAEDQLTQALPKMVKEALDKELQQAFADHLEETKNHKKRLEDICEELGIDPTREKCKAMAGIIKEAEDFLDKNPSDSVKSAGMIADAQRVEHYEIAGYGAVCTYAEELGLEEIAKKLKQTLSEEVKADEKLKELAKNRINMEAKA